MRLPTPSPEGLAGCGGEAPELQVRQVRWLRNLPHTCPFICGNLFYAVVTLEAAGLSLGPCRAQLRLVQWTVEHHIRQNGDFQLLFRPAVLFGKFEFLRRSQIF